MRKHKVISLLLAGALVLGSVTADSVHADTKDMILTEDEQDSLLDDSGALLSDGEDTRLTDDMALIPDGEDTRLLGDEDLIGDGPDEALLEESGDAPYKGGEYLGYVEPEWAGEPTAVDEDLTIGEVDGMVEGNETLYDENGVAYVTDLSGFNADKASIEPISEDTAELPPAFPSPYGEGSASDLEAIDEALNGRITPERIQSPYGSCWAHETIALTEAYKINKQGGDPASIDNSERHLVYNTYNAGTNPLIADTGDVAILNGTNEITYLQQGGNVPAAAMTFNKWRGVALESEAPYSTIKDGSWTNTEFLSTGGRLENCYMINIKENPDMVKRFIREYGAVGVSYYSKSGTNASTDNESYKQETNAYYCTVERNTNHGVAIVGWDDNFPASSFVSDPGSDGAWLIRNSWKAGGKVSDKAYASYFWMSYKDKSLAERAFAMKMQDQAGYSDHNYFYDTQYHGAEVIYIDNYEIEAANVFKIDGGAAREQLDSVTIETFVDKSKNKVSDTGYKVSVYANLTDPKKPDSGTLVAGKEGDLPFLGIYTVKFDSPIVMKKGTVFSVVVSINGGGRSVDMELDATPADGGEQYMCRALEGQSFYRYKQNGEVKTSWTDNTSITEKKTRAYGNFCIGVQTSDYSGDKYAINAYSRTDKSEDPVAAISLSTPSAQEGSEVTATAADISGSGYTFLGWFKATGIEDGKVTSYEATPLCQTLKYTFIAGGDLDLVAVYKESAEVKLTVDVKNGASYRLGSNTYSRRGVLTSRVGKTHTLYAVDPDKVLCWLNEDDEIIGRGDSVRITLTGDKTITLVYRDEASGEAYLQFLSAYGQVLSSKKVLSSSSSYNIPAGPERYGYTFTGWKFEGTDTPVTNEAIRAKIPAGGIITCVAVYTKKEDKYSVTVKYTCSGNSIKDPDVFPDKAVGTEYTALAPEISGYTFECWKDEGGEVLGCAPEYYMMMKGNTVLTASYLPEASPGEKRPVITLGSLYKSGEGKVKKVSGAATRSVPDGYELIEHGMLYARNVSGLTDTSFVYGTKGVGRYVAGDPDNNGVFYLNVRVLSDKIPVSLRGYMVLKDKSTGSIDTYYTKIKTGTYSQL